MQMVSGASPGAADLGNDIPGADGLPLGHENFRAVTVKCNQPAAVVDGEVISVAGGL